MIGPTRGSSLNRSASRCLAAAIAVVCLATAPAALRAQQQPVLVVDSVEVVGAVRVQAENIAAVFGVARGDEITYRDVQRGMKALLYTGQFRDLTVRARGTPPEPIVLVIEVVEEALVRRVEINGLEHASPREVRDTANLDTGLPLSRQRILDAKVYIREELAKEGIPFAQIADRVSPVPGGENEVDLILDVTEGQRVTVAQVDFLGNQQLSDQALRGSMSTKPEGFWWFRPGSFNEIDYRLDLDQSVPAMYRSRGFLDAQVVSDTLLIDPATGKARIEITVAEGEQYRLNSFRVNGNSVFTADQFESMFIEPRGGILSMLGIGGSERTNATGEVFDGEAFNAARDRALQQYYNQGYLYASINPVVNRIRPDDGGPPGIDASWEVVEGNPAIVNRVSIVGNEYTYEWVIRNQLTVIPGDVYSQDRVLQSYQSISSLGFFEVPMPNPDIVPNENGDVDITFTVEEKQTGSINFGTSVGGGVGLSGFIGYEQPNLFGQAKSGSLRWDFGRYINSFEVAYADPALFQSLVSGRITLFNSRDRFFQFSSGRRRRIGANVRFGFPLRSSLFTRVFVGYGISRTKYELFNDVDDSSLFGRPPGVQSQLSVGITRQTLDHPVFPTTGSRQNVTVELNGGVLGGDGQFTRLLTDGTWWVPVGRLGGDGGQGGIRLALGLTMRAGAVFGNVDRFPFDRFWMGGVQFGQQLRGYDETSITPLGWFPERSGSVSDIDRLGNAYFSLTAEYAIRLTGQISMSAFYDAGNVWRRPNDFDPTRLFRGAGAGIQLVTPFGPIGLDYAYAFDKTFPGWQFHFRMGPGF
ncbi:MAG: outer membrane protein assembly factor BamA [Gemmatimonadota bacterium]|nr:outer membrane protein assembly factor BamA [Gemmatimonadota bacterium]